MASRFRRRSRGGFRIPIPGVKLPAWLRLPAPAPRLIPAVVPVRRRGAVPMSARVHRILLVEDHPVIRDLVTDVLTGQGCIVLACDHVPDAVDVAQLRPDAVVLDLRLPNGHDGADLLAAMRATPGARSIPVVVCAGDRLRAEADATRFAGLGAAVLIKPFDLDDLVGTVTTNVAARFERLQVTAAPAAEGSAPR